MGTEGGGLCGQRGLRKEGYSLALPRGQLDPPPISKTKIPAVTKAIPISAEIAVELQQLYVTVSRNDHRILDLDESEFTVLDEGRRQSLVTFARGDIPFTATLLIDASASMYGEKLAAATEGAATFVRGMQDLDQAKVFVFSDTILNSTPFTDAKQVLSAGLSAARASGGTALHDHLFMALKLLEDAGELENTIVFVTSDNGTSVGDRGKASAYEWSCREPLAVMWPRRAPAGRCSSNWAVRHRARNTIIWRSDGRQHSAANCASSRLAVSCPRPATSSSSSLPALSPAGSPRSPGRSSSM